MRGFKNPFRRLTNNKLVNKAKGVAKSVAPGPYDWVVAHQHELWTAASFGVGAVGVAGVQATGGALASGSNTATIAALQKGSVAGGLLAGGAEAYGDSYRTAGIDARNAADAAEAQIAADEQAANADADRLAGVEAQGRANAGRSKAATLRLGGNGSDRGAISASGLSLPLPPTSAALGLNI